MTVTDESRRDSRRDSRSCHTMRNGCPDPTRPDPYFCTPAIHAANRDETAPIDDLTHPVWRWSPWRTPSITHVSLGSDRYAEHTEPFPPRRPVGFAPPPRVGTPLLWEGDDA